MRLHKAAHLLSKRSIFMSFLKERKIFVWMSKNVKKKKEKKVYLSPHEKVNKNGPDASCANRGESSQAKLIFVEGNHLLLTP